MTLTQPQLKPGAILAGRWQIQDFIGSGETGEVYGVRDMHGVSAFALKLFWPHALAQAEIWSAVQQTARTASGLGVDGVARAYDFGIDANSARPFFVTERISWSSLAERVRVRGPLTPAEMSTALVVLARTLDAAHAAGVVHRDLKPDNVFIAPDNANWVRISDFGVALLRSASPPPPGWGGSIGWVSPDAADLKARSTPAMDIFSLGLVTFFALSGGALHRAARGTPIDPTALWAELGAPLDSAAVRARELGAALDEAFDPWFQRAVAPLPQHRFSSVTEMASAFDAVVRTLIAPHSQNAVALPGIAVALAQPLLFQLDAPRSVPDNAAPAAPAAVPASAPVPEAIAISSGPAQKSAAPLLIGGAISLFAVTGLGFAALYHHRAAATEAATPAARVSPAEPPSASIASLLPAQTPSAASPTPTVSVASSAVAAAASAPATGGVTPAVTASAKALAPKLSALVPAKPVATAATNKPSASAMISPKPAGSAATALKPATKPSLITPPKKKCGSTFIPCK